jgi:hypothetical protein
MSLCTCYRKIDLLDEIINSLDNSCKTDCSKTALLPTSTDPFICDVIREYIPKKGSIFPEIHQDYFKKISKT